METSPFAGRSRGLHLESVVARRRHRAARSETRPSSFALARDNPETGRLFGVCICVMRPAPSRAETCGPMRGSGSTCQSGPTGNAGIPYIVVVQFSVYSKGHARKILSRQQFQCFALLLENAAAEASGELARLNDTTTYSHVLTAATALFLCIPMNVTES